MLGVAATGSETDSRSVAHIEGRGARTATWLSPLSSAAVCSARVRSDPWLVCSSALACVFFCSDLLHVAWILESIYSISSGVALDPSRQHAKSKALNNGVRFPAPLPMHTPAHTGERCKRHTHFTIYIYILYVNKYITCPRRQHTRNHF